MTHATWELVRAPATAPHALAVALRTLAVVLAFIALWFLIALALQSEAGVGPGMPLPGLDL